MVFDFLPLKYRRTRALVWSDIFTNNMGKEMARKWEAYLLH
jgi:hypothetical protein